MTDDTTESDDGPESWREERAKFAEDGAEWPYKPMREWTPEELEAAREARKKQKEQERQEYLDSRPDNPYEDSRAKKSDVVPPVNMKASANWMAEARDENDDDGHETDE